MSDYAAHIMADEPAQYFASEKPSNHAINGRLGGFKAAETKRSNKEKLAQLEALVPQALTLAISRPKPNPEHSRSIKVIEKQIKAIDKAMTGELTPKDWQALTMSKAKLWEVYAHMTGIPKPMAPREPRETRRTIQSMSQPIELAPVPAQPAFDYSQYKIG